jgi:uncharacterized membrane protein YgcG
MPKKYVFCNTIFPSLKKSTLYGKLSPTILQPCGYTTRENPKRESQGDDDGGGGVGGGDGGGGGGGDGGGGGGDEEFGLRKMQENINAINRI